MLAKDTLEEFQLECALRRLAPRTIKGYYNSTLLLLNRLDRQQEITEPKAIRPQHIKQYIQYLIKKQLTPSYINSILRCIRAYFRYATEDEYLTSNPAARNKLILAITFDTGARNTEMCDILEEDVRDNVILIHGKGNKEQHVPLTPYLKRAILKYRRIKEQYFADKIIPYKHLLLSRTGRPMTKEAMEHVFKQAAAQADVRTNIRCSPHTARHYFAQTHLRNGLDVYSVSRLLGHENINITKRYLQSIQKEGAE